LLFELSFHGVDAVLNQSKLARGMVQFVDHLVAFTEDLRVHDLV